MQYPGGRLTSEQEGLAQFGGELFDRLSRKIPSAGRYPLAATSLDSGGVVVAQSVRGGGRIFVAPDKSVLFVSSEVGTQSALEVFRNGRRTPVESFGPE